MPGVYISFPFCAQKCTYCNFSSGVFPPELELRYIESLVKEIEAHRWEWEPETVYIGGGTPSRLPADDLSRVLAAVPGHPWREATIEAAPGDLTPDLVRAWHKTGINRVSFGVQSFIPRELAQTGRRHTAETVQGEVALLRDQGITNISLDLIAGLPHQTPESFSESVEWAHRLDVPHVSVYMLEIDEDSRLGLEILSEGGRYGAQRRPSEEMVVDMYLQAADKLAELGLLRYEISNFAKCGFQSLHNLKYWRVAPYIGFGADAHSFDGEFRWQNCESAAEYVVQPKGVVKKIKADLSEERLMVGLRLSTGVALSQEDWLRHRPAIDRFVRNGLVTSEGDILRLTDHGVLYSNEVFEEFVTA